MARTLVTIKSDLFDDPAGEDASIRENLAIRVLIDEIVKEFDLPEGNYTLKLEGTNKVLESDKTLELYGVSTGSVLAFSRDRRAGLQRRLDGDAGTLGLSGAPGSRTMIQGGMRAFLKEVESGEIMPLQWQPAIIGRPDAGNPASGELLAVNLGKHPGAQSVSRQHAKITEAGGQYFIEALSERNPTFLNEGEVRFGEKRLLQPGDQVRVGSITMAFGIRAG